MRTIMLYKCIKAIRFYSYLFDLDTGLYYKISNSGNLKNYGYFLITACDKGDWRMLKQLSLGKNEHYNLLPLFTKLSLLSFLVEKFSTYKTIQKVINSLEF